MKVFKPLVITAIVMIFIVACKQSDNKKDNNESINANIEFNVICVADSAENYTNDPTISNVVSIRYFEVKSNDSQNIIVDNINKDFFAWLSSFLFTEGQRLATKDDIKTAIASDIKKFIKDVDEDESLIDCEPCRNVEFTIDTCGFYQTNYIISIIYNHYVYGGGAHGYYGITTFNYDKQTAEPITIDNLSTNIDELTAIAEKAFVQQNGDIKDFWFEKGTFYLPKIFYFTTKGIVFYYSIYEIACYADGAISVELDYSKVKNLIEYIK